MAKKAASTKAAKQVRIVARYAHKTDGKLNGIVTYAVRSSNGTDIYYTTLVNGKATGCGCPAFKPCYHMDQLEALEAARAAKAIVETPSAEPVSETIVAVPVVEEVIETAIVETPVVAEVTATVEQSTKQAVTNGYRMSDALAAKLASFASADQRETRTSLKSEKKQGFCLMA